MIAVMNEKQKYFRDLLAAKFNREDLDKVAKTWGRTKEQAQQDFIHVQRLHDGMVMYMKKYVDMYIV